MDDLTLNLIVILAVAILVGGIFLIIRHKQAANEQKLRQMAAERGWTYQPFREPLAWGLRLSAPGWTFEALSRSSGRETAPGSSDVAMSTTWRADAPGSTLLIGPRTSQANLGSLGEAISRQVLQLALGADADGLVEIQAGSAALRQKYMLWTQDPAEAEKLLTLAVQSALLKWKGQPPLIKRTSDGLTIELRGVRLTKADEILSVVNLGKVLLG